MTALIFETAASLFQCFIGMNFILKFNHTSWLKNKLAIPAFLLVFLTVMDGDFVSPGFSTVISIIITILYLVFALLICRKQYVRGILAVCIEQSTILLVGSILYSVFSSVIDNFDLPMHGEDNLGRFIYVIISNLLIYAVLKLALAIFNSDSLDTKTGLIAFVMSVITLAGLSVSMSFSEKSFSKEIEAQILILTLIFVSINVILYVMIAQMQNLQKNKYELQLLREKMKFDENRHNDAAAVWDNVRKVQHDMKHHLTVISGQLESGQTDECKAYIRELLPTVERFGETVRTENKVLDYLINSKLCSIEDAQIVISGSVGDLSDIRDIDLACLMSNILDNAIEAIALLERKKIDLLFLKQNSNRVIICKNTIAESFLAKNKDLNSTKTADGTHGYGHIIINRIVQDYNGMVEYFEEDGMFGVQVVLPMK